MKLPSKFYVQIESRGYKFTHPAELTISFKRKNKSDIVYKQSTKKA